MATDKTRPSYDLSSSLLRSSNFRPREGVLKTCACAVRLRVMFVGGMGEILSDFTLFAERLQTFIVSYTTNRTPLNSSILRFNRKLHCCDISVAAAVIKILTLNVQDSKAFSGSLLKESAHWPFLIDSCQVTHQGALAINLHHPSVFKKVLTAVFREKENYGRFNLSKNNYPGVGIVNNSLLGDGKESGKYEGEKTADITLNQLRSLLLSEHLLTLLDRAGCLVTHLTPAADISSQILDKFRINVLQTRQKTGNDSSLSQPKRETQERLVQSARCCHFRTLCQSSSHQDSARSGEPVRNTTQVVPETCETSNKDIYLDLRGFINEKKLPVGKSGYDKNLNKVKVLSADGSLAPVLSQCCYLDDGISQMLPKPSYLIHIVSQAASFHQQQQDIVWQLCSSQASSESIHQFHLIHGRVVARQLETQDSENVSAIEFLKIREAQTREASVLKYGEEVQGEGWEELIRRLTTAALKFEILGKQSHHTLTLNLSGCRNSGTWPNSKDGVFVMYNYARLCTLFDHFQDDVTKGTYPHLPDVSDSDFSLLREDQEWGLLFNYVLQYPVMLNECIRGMLEVEGVQVNIQTHRVCSFLVSLCRDLSSYYSHTHILVEPRPHLLATMFARLHLLKGVQQILKNGLSLLNIEPLTQM